MQVVNHQTRLETTLKIRGAKFSLFHTTLTYFTDESLTDKTAVGSLFTSHPSMIGKMALMLDVNEHGKKNWQSLAEVFEVDRRESQNFTKAIEDNPAKKLLEVLKVKYPKMTVRNLIEKLDNRKWKVISDVLTNCKEG